MKINSLDLAKTISDFMFLGVLNPEKKAKVIYKIKHKLTAHGFEKYMQYYFEIKKGYKVKIGHTYKFDGGIDLKGIKKLEDGTKKYLIVQCKKYSIKDITENDLRSFHGGTFHKYLEYKNDTNVYYITTSKFTYKAKDFAKEVGIKIVDFSNIYDLQKTYPIERFEIDLRNKEGIKEYIKSFNKEQLILNIDDNVYNTIETTDKQVYDLLRQIRRDYSHITQLRLSDIAKNDTLKILSQKRPHNFKALKENISGLSYKEKSKIEKYGNIFLDRLKYIN